jgi:hypothetical protein
MKKYDRLFLRSNETAINAIRADFAKVLGMAKRKRMITETALTLACFCGACIDQARISLYSNTVIHI